MREKNSLLFNYSDSVGSYVPKKINEESQVGNQTVASFGSKEVFKWVSRQLNTAQSTHSGGVLVCVEIVVKNEFMILRSYKGVVMAKARLQSGQGHPRLEKNVLTRIKTALCFGSD